MTEAVLVRLKRKAHDLPRHHIGKTIARTAAFNFGATFAAGLGAVILARSFGPHVLGEYAAITAWYGVALVIGDMGQAVAVCFHVARYPDLSREYVATSRTMMVATGFIAIVAGLIISPLLSDEKQGLMMGYQIAFGALIIVFVGSSYLSSLQAKDLDKWNVVRVSQPILSLIATAILWWFDLLTLDIAILVLAGSMLLQLLWAYYCCRRVGLAPGRSRRNLIRPLAKYGLPQIAAAAPAALNTQLDQLVLSQTVPSAVLGRYAVAVSLSLIPIPFVSAIGNVLFPRLASRDVDSGGTERMQWIAILCGAAAAVIFLVPFDLIAPRLVIMIFGARYQNVVPILWILTPGTIFLCCGRIASDLLRGRNRSLAIAVGQGVSAVVTVMLLVALLPLIGVYGAAIASTVAYGVALAIMLVSLWRLKYRYVGKHSKRDSS
jgi:O-antigen/teichoic acid export membrane protein